MVAGRVLDAQGVAAAALQGVARRADGNPLAGATVLVIDPSTGQRWQGRTGHDGRYFLDQLAVGGPYVIEARQLGFALVRRTGIMLALGSRQTADFVLAEATVRLGAVTVQGS